MIPSRLGGDEFTALAKSDSDEYPAKLKKRLSEYLSQINKSSGKEYTLSASIGYIRFQSNEQIDLLNLLNAADAALYKEKKKKRA